MERTSRLHPVLRSYLERCCELGASDVHLSGDAEPYYRLNGAIVPMGQERLDPREVDQMARSVMVDGQEQVFRSQRSLDMALSLPDGNRFRINAFMERGRTALSIRLLARNIRTLEQLNLPSSIGELADIAHGLVLVCGPTGSGKSTTLATLIHRVNLTRKRHIITIEDPIEYLHGNHESLVRQRELHSDVNSFADAVRSALREDPDVLLIGEMRDPETMLAALTAAETGHLVFSTLHTANAVGVVDRIIGSFDGGQQSAMRQQLSSVLRAVVTQRLLPSRDRNERFPALEILRVTPAVANLVSSGNPQQIHSAMEAGTEQGMLTLEQSLADLVLSGRVDMSSARAIARDRVAFESRLRIGAEAMV